MGDAGAGDAMGRSPGDLGFRLAADFAPHELVAIAWPTMQRIDFWRNHLGAARDAYAVAIRAIAEFERVLVIADEGEGRSAEGWLGDGIEVIELPIDDAWIRDTGPLVVRDDAGTRLGVQFGFNGWGGKVATWTRDASVAEQLCDHLDLEHRTAPLVLEGGAVTTDGEGTIITTEQCVRHPNRNPDVDPTGIERTFADHLGAREVVWLTKGLADDRRTDGHVSNVAAFTAPGRVLLQTTTDVSDPDHQTARQNRARLEAAGLKVDEIDVLPHVQCFDQIVEVPYLNFHVANDAVLVPLAGAAADHEMLERIGDCFPGRRTVGVPGTVLAYGGGGVRSITMPIPS